MNNKTTKNLKLNLFLIPTVVILISFCVILLAFNIVINRYTQSIVSKQLKEELELFDEYNNYNDANMFYSQEKEEEDFIMPVHYVILDDNYTMLYPEDDFYSEFEKNRAYEIREYFVKNPDNLNQNNDITISIENRTYYVKSKTYKGNYYDDYFNENEKKSSESYTVFFYINISQMQNFLNTLNMILFGLMILSGIISIIVIFQMAKKIDNSFNKLKSYIIKVGKRETLNNLEELPYKEFNDVAKTVDNMSKMIDNAENSQKQFFQNASHELRTPLMSIQGYAEAIKSGVVKDDKAVNIIIKESERMSNLVNEILFLSKMEMGESKINQEVLNVKELIYDFSWSIKGSTDKKNIKIEHQLMDEDIEIYGNEQRLERAFLNILSNAVRYAKEKIIISLESKDDNFIIKITDDGEGINQKDLPHIFERFYKGDGGNFGIGLSITKDLIKQHNGNISVLSEVGKTSFIVELPKYKNIS